VAEGPALPAVTGGLPAATGASPAATGALPPAPGGLPAATGALLAGVAGFVDTAAFVGLQGLFAAHVTGNFVLLGAALVLGTGGILAKLATFPVFVLSIVVTRLLERRAGLPRLLLAMAALLAVFALLGLLLGPFRDPDATALIVTAIFAVAAMGIQNALGRTLLSAVMPTTIMTGNTTGAVLALTDWVAAGLPPPERARLRGVALVLGGFAAGCGLGAAGLLLVGFWALALPIAALAWLSSAARSRTDPTHPSA